MDAARSDAGDAAEPASNAAQRSSAGWQHPWLFAATAPGHSLAEGSLVALEADEVRHATGARRLRRGDEVVIFDGRGTLARARLRAGERASQSEGAREGPRTGRRETQREGQPGLGTMAEVLELARVDPPRPMVTIAAAIPKGDRSAVMIDMATQLGLAAFIPLICARAVVQPTPALLGRLSRVAVEACKQSRRAHLPQIAEARSLGEVLAGSALQPPESRTSVLLAEPTGVPLRSLGVVGVRVVVLIGPEGGFTADEQAEARAGGAIPVSLGDGILRIETAAAAAVQELRGGASIGCSPSPAPPLA